LSLTQKKAVVAQMDKTLTNKRKGSGGVGLWGREAGGRIETKGKNDLF